MFPGINLIINFLSGYLLMIQSNLEKLVYRINNYVNNNPHLFNTNFNIKICLNIENKKIFRQGFCGAITAGGASMLSEKQTGFNILRTTPL